MSRSALTALFVAAVFPVVAVAGAAKEFEPGDLRICNAKRCVPIMDRTALTALGALYYICLLYTSPSPRDS